MQIANTAPCKRPRLFIEAEHRRRFVEPRLWLPGSLRGLNPEQREGRFYRFPKIPPKFVNVSAFRDRQKASVIRDGESDVFRVELRKRAAMQRGKKDFLASLRQKPLANLAAF